jgi:Bacterial Ig-like domain (group 3)
MQPRTICLPLAAALLSGLSPSRAIAIIPIGPALIPVTVTLAANNATVSQGSAVILTATVTPNSAPPKTGEQNPTGNVVFYNGTTTIGQSTLSSLPTNSASTATLSIQTLPAGQDSITAYYAGDTVFGSDTSAPLALAVQAFTLAPAATNPATNLDIAQGGSGAVSFIIGSAGGFNGQVQVLCTVALQDDMTCTPTPQQVTPTATVTFAVKTFVTGGPLYAAVKRHPRNPFWTHAAGGIALAALVFFVVPIGFRARRRLDSGARRFLILFVLLAGLAVTGIACNSSSVLTPTGTPLGVATLKVTATAYINNGVTSQTLYFTVNVQPQ